MTDYIYHITLDTGDIAPSARGAVSNSILRMMGSHLKQALAVGRDIIPTTAHTLMATHEGANLIGTILSMTGRPILTFAVAGRSRGAGKLWTTMIGDRGYSPDPGDPPQAPWLAVRMEAGASHSSIEPWMADYERCIAWAWIEGAAK